MQKSLQTLTDLSTDIKVAADSEALRVTHQNMISSATIIKRAFSQFENYAASILAKDATADEALERMYTLLHDSDTPSAVHTALLEYQTMVLGSSAGSAVGLLSQVPNIIKGSWEDCAANIATPGWTAAGPNGTRPRSSGTVSGPSSLRSALKLPSTNTPPTTGRPATKIGWMASTTSLTAATCTRTPRWWTAMASACSPSSALS